MKPGSATQVIARYESELRSRNTDATEPPFDVSRCAAVFVMFTIHEGVAKLLLMRRPWDRGRHRGEWSFPGGVRERIDGSLLQTAYRETEEEFGIPESQIEFWGGLEPVKTVGTMFEVWPFAGWVKPGVRLSPSEAEVEEIAHFPVETFTCPEARRSIFLNRDGRSRDIRAYVHEGKVVWGATARILSQVFDAPPSSGDSAGEPPGVDRFER